MIYYRYPNSYNMTYIPCNMWCCNSKINEELMLASNEKFMMCRKEESEQKAVLKEQKIYPDVFRFSYPFEVSLGNKDIKHKVNDEIVNTVLSLFKDQVFTEDKVDFKEIYVFYDVPLNDKGILSILFGIYTYAAGAAHGYTAYKSLTIDLNSGKVYNFEDLFNPKVNYRGILSEIAKKQIEDSNVPIIEKYNGIVENQSFYLTKDELVLYYQVYEYTPYYYGLFKIHIPYKKIENLLGPLSPIQKLL